MDVAHPPATEQTDPGPMTAFVAKARRFAEDLANPQEATAWGAIAVLAVMLVYSYWPGLLNAKSSWNNPQYSHGWIVPLFSAGLLLWWRQPVADVVPTRERLVGLGLLAASFALRLAVARYRIVTIDMYTFVPALASVFLMVGGWSMFRWAWAPIAFLIFMYPLPDEATRYLLGPLQTLATMVSTYALQTLGLDAYREGNQIILGEMHLGVVDACSGLRMLTIFVALSVALVMLGDREWWENVVVIASAIPIALIVNSIRITVTGLLYKVASTEIAEMVFHDLAGWVMMPMALGMLFVLQQILAKLFFMEEAEFAPLRPIAAPAAPPAPIARRPTALPSRPAATPVVPIRPTVRTPAAPVPLRPVPMGPMKPPATQAAKPQPIRPHPVPVKPVTVQPVMVQPMTVRPAAGQPIAVKPVAGQPPAGNARPSQGPPVSSQPPTVQPVTGPANAGTSDAGPSDAGPSDAEP